MRFAFRCSLKAACVAALLALVVLPLRAAQADVKAGDVITAANVDQAKELISPGLEWCIRHGWPAT